MNHIRNWLAHRCLKKQTINFNLDGFQIDGAFLSRVPMRDITLGKTIEFTIEYHPNFTYETIRQWSGQVGRFAVHYEINHVISGPLDYHVGYVTFPSPPHLPDDHERITALNDSLSVTELNDGAVCYGFDNCHLLGTQDPQWRDLDWLTNACEKLARDIVEASTPRRFRIKMKFRFLGWAKPILQGSEEDIMED